MEASEGEIKYREKYEAMLRGTMKEIEGTVRKAQKRAEDNSKISQQRVHLLTEQLSASEKRVKNLERQLEETKTRLNEAESTVNVMLQKKLQCLECMCCLSMSVSMDHNQQPVYTCTVDDGALNGHTFELTLDSDRWEYMYRPVEPAECLSADNDLSKTIWFPDYMIPRFLSKLLAETYKNAEEIVC